MSNTCCDELIDTIWDALLFLELRREGKMRGEQWEKCEMRALKKACFSKNAPTIGPDLYRAMVAENNGWSYKAGAIDSDTVDHYQRQYEKHLQTADLRNLAQGSHGLVAGLPFDSAARSFRDGPLSELISD
jgi:hypothetical protein